MSHEIVALNSHLLEAKVTIDKLSEDNVSTMCLWPLEECGRCFLGLPRGSLGRQGPSDSEGLHSSSRGGWAGQ